jgi:tRNA threonylcarbamoyl adenosine modification protein (Sua5/YciO/YrdC/YwlC family)
VAKYFDVHPDNPQSRAINQVVEIIRGGGLVAYPTDSCFALGCRLGDKDGLDRIREIRHLDDRHHFTLVCRDFAQLGQFATINNSLFRSIKAATPGAYTFILPATDSGECGTEPTTVIDFSSGEAEILRKGAGDPARFE